MIQFGRLDPDGTYEHVRSLSTADIERCPQLIMVASHYRADGSCKCDDPAERAMMIREWGYSEEDFK